MTGWLIMIVLAAAVGVGLARFGRFPRGAVELLGAALLLALAGYAWQGNAGLAGRPTPPRTQPAGPDRDYGALRETMFERFTGDAQVLTTADAFQRQGLDLYAIGVLRSALVRRPRSADLWTGMGNALVAHADGLVTPAAELAFARATKASPLHPGPPFFLGLAYAQAGQLEEARAAWAGLLARTPPDAPWRADLALRVRAVDRLLGDVR
ncbi:tetratricopeptide repeat protein [Sphingomonas montana]|uniref:tetratricopeptide repeat protein n=1 Tax=Sphingomonas montana TaxID=1843236 RepID=UPI00096EEB18|nr:cytochrome C biogenesis protein [Sphingomonas montana]